MSERILMNSKSLQKRFAKIYEDFFLQNDLVLSGCFSFPWGPGLVGHRSTLGRTRTKIPLKCYVGIKKRKDNKIIFNDVIFYNLISESFNSCEYKDLIKEEEEIKKLLRNFLDASGYKEGFEISILSETTRGHSLGFSGTSSAIIVTGIFLLINKFKLELLENYEDFINNSIFKEIFLLGWKMDFISRYGNSIGENLLSCLYNNKGMLLFYCENFDSNIDIEKLGDIYVNYSTFATKFKESNITTEIPLDYCVVFSGIPTDTKQIEQFKKVESKIFDKYTSFIKDDFLSKEGISKNIYFQKFMDKEVLVSSFVDIISILNIKTINLLKELYENGYSSALVEDFIDHINSYRGVISITEKQNSFADEFNYFFRKYKTNYEEKIGILPIYSGKLGGGYLIVTKQGLSRDTLNKALEEIKTFYPNVVIEHSSYLDGDCSDGIAVEQYISSGIFSGYIQKDQMFFKNNKGDNYISWHEDIIKQEKDCLIFDTISNKIYLNGEKLTSKDIPSQNSTIEILGLLLDNLGNEVSNNELSCSSYSKNKNEMVGKIIAPILHFTETKFGEKLSLSIKGSMTNFYLKLDDSNVKIGIIKKI